jgi:hypothetical protein
VLVVGALLVLLRRGHADAGPSGAPEASIRAEQNGPAAGAVAERTPPDRSAFRQVPVPPDVDVKLPPQVVAPPQEVAPPQVVAQPPEVAAPQQHADACAATDQAAPVCQVDHHYGTSIDFVDSPTAAAEQALKDGKLLFVLHVAGNFEKDAFT